MKFLLLDHVEKKSIHITRFLNLPPDLHHIQSTGQKNTILTTEQLVPQININFIFKMLRVKANTKQGQT